MEKNIFKKLGMITIVVLLLFSSFVVPLTAKDNASVEKTYKTQSGTKEVGWDTMGYTATVGESVTARLWGNVWNENFTGFYVYNLTWAPAKYTPGILNLSSVTNGDSVTWVTWDASNTKIYNATGNMTGAQAGRLGFGNVTGNYSLLNLTFYAREVGFCYLNFTAVTKFSVPGIELLDDIGVGLSGTIINNNTFTVYPAQPATLTATKYNHTAINLTFTPGDGGNNITLCGKAGSYPTGPTDSVLYNGSLTKYNDTGLTPCTGYYYRAWTWNETEDMHSEDYKSAFATTQCYTNFTFTGVTPANQTERANCTSYNVPVNLTISNSKGHAFNWWINTSNGDAWSGSNSANGSKGGTMSGLSHNTLYWWNVSVNDATGTGDSHSENYWFITGRGGGTSPGTPTSPNPSTGSSSINIDIGTFEVDVTDADGDLLNVTFYWSNGTVIGTDTLVASGGTATINPALTLNYGQTYSWYVQSNDSCQQTRGPASGYWTFTTDTQSLAIVKDCQPSATNHSIRYIINVTNDGQSNLTNIVINESFDTNIHFWKASPAENGNYWWDVGYLNMSNTSTIVIWVNQTTCANGTSLVNTVNVSNSTGGILDIAYCNKTVAFTLDKDVNGSIPKWNTSHINYTINITNSGDTYLENITVNESFSANVTFFHSNYPANATNTSFRCGSLAPGATISLYIIMNTSYGLTGEILINGTRIYNNFTVRTNQTTPEVTKSTYTLVGARTELIRITYDRQVPDMLSIGNSLFAVIGAILIIGTIFIIIYITRQGGLFGGEGTGGAE